MEVDEIESMSKLFSALSHPTRLKILALCAVKERSSRELREILGISKPLLIAHLKVLLSAGLLTYRAEIDPERFIVRKYYRVPDNLKLCIDVKLLRSLAERIAGPARRGKGDGRG